MTKKLSKDSYILAVDTSCDETSVAILKGRNVLINIVASQTELHKKWGGVVPDVARRAHLENLPKAYSEVLKRTRLSINDIDLIAVTIGPGLAIDLEVGIQFCKELAIENKIPFIPINHMEGHLLSSLALNSKGNGSVEDINGLFPALGLLVSGKHTELIYLEGFGKYQKIGKTLDDAAGEAFDKFGRMLGFGYPGGPIVSEFAEKFDHVPNPDLELPIPMAKSGDFNFSYSGLKTSCLYKINALREQGKKDSEWVYNLCFNFVETVAKSLTIKLSSAIAQYPEVKSLFAGGGVYQSEFITRAVGSCVRQHGLKYLLPEMKYRSDNAVMIGIAAWANIDSDKVITDKTQIEAIDRIPRFSL